MPPLIWGVPPLIWEVPLLIWEVPPLIWEVPLLIWGVPPLIWCKLRIKPASPTWLELELGLSLAIMIRSVIGPEEMPILVRGWCKHPPTKMGST